MSTETIPVPPDTFANPFILCTYLHCGKRVTNVIYPGGFNVPCGHVGSVDTCPSWGPVDGCVCRVPHRSAP